ncbi:fibronectin type III domain-containing protein [Spiractinospora alimapuensis]|uniref:fibronectin type III domain-containing protein n=1 Tax=Spiractinospora alimapuensis TaxID=2820884 RepID=UPI001F22B7C1|nr:fibronectin type III domain-containing protein [Spiractinospora alimapuensis]QVQ53865.1 fibronectin type III domain-containing protein [Spiractinospora alimapuensis]
MGRALRSSAAGITVGVLGLAVVSTALGIGATGSADEMSDGSAWLWNASGEATRVNAHNARVDLAAALPESEGGQVEVTQNDQYLLLRDQSSGKVTSVDLTDMGYSGVLEMGAGTDFHVALGQETAVVIDRTRGEVKAVDPATLQSTGPTITLPAPLTGGAFDREETLWLGVPAQGALAGITVTDDEATLGETPTVADPDSDLDVTVLDGGALAYDRGGNRLVLTGADRDPEPLGSPVALDGAEAPDRTTGAIAAVTVPSNGDIVTVDVTAEEPEVDSFSVDHPGVGTAVPFEGRIYAPFEQEGTVRVYQPNGRELAPISLPDAEGPLELEAREDHLFINAPESSVAAVVNGDGQTNIIDKSAPPPGEEEAGGSRASESEESDGTDGAVGTGYDGGDTVVPSSPGTSTGSPEPGDGGGSGSDEDPGNGSEGGDGGESPSPSPSPEANDDEGSPPSAPAPVSHTTGDSSVELSWSAAHSPDAPVDEYTITWDEGSTTVPGDEVSTEIDDLENGVGYVFRVQGSNRYGTGPAAQSSQAIPESDAPGAASGVSAEESGVGRATVSWDESDNASDYLVTTVSDGGSNVADRTSGGTSVDVNGLEPGETYRFTVTPRSAGGAAGESAISDPLTMSEAEVGAPDSVDFSVEGGSVTVTWSEVEHATQYTVTPHGDGAAALDEVTVNGGDTSHTYQRGAGRCYAFTVTAVGAGGPAETNTKSSTSCVRDFN